MLLIPKVLKRKDASSVVVAIVLGMILVQLFQMWSMSLTNEVVNSNTGINSLGWKDAYLNPAISAVIAMVLLELSLWVWSMLRDMSKSK